MKSSFALFKIISILTVSSIAISGCGSKISVNKLAAKIAGLVKSSSAPSPAGAIKFSPTPAPSVTFGNVITTQSSATTTLTILNTGTVATSGCTAASLSGPDALQFTLSSNTCGTTAIAASGTCTVDVAFTPVLSQAGARSAFLTYACTEGGTAVATLTGNALEPTLVWASPTPLVSPVNYGTLPTTAGIQDQTFVFVNTGTTSATGCGALTLSGSTDFSLVSNTCTGASFAIGNCSVITRFTPGTTGIKNATLTRTCTYGGSVSASVTATVATAAQVAYSPAPAPTFSFANTITGQSSSVQTVTVINYGAFATSGCVATALSGADASQFTLSNNTCGATALAASGTCTVDVTFTPGTSGAKTASLNYVCTNGGTASAHLNGSSVEAVVTASPNPTTLSFGAVPIGNTSSALTGAFRNSGLAGATSCATPVISGTDAGQFTLSTAGCGTSLASLATCSPQVTFSPTGSAGARNATLTYACGAGSVSGANLTGTITLSGTAANPGAIVYTPTQSPSHSFGSTVTGQASSWQTFTLTNSGGVSATGCTAPALSGADSGQFSLQSNTCIASLAPAATCTVQARFNPGAAQTGSKSASLTYSCTVGGADIASLSGTGIEAQVQASPLPKLALDFGTIQTTVTSAAQTTTLRNYGNNTASSCSAPALSGTHAADFTITVASCGASLAAGATCSPQVTVRPSATGTRTATLTYACTVGGAGALSETISLTGVGATAALVAVLPTSRAYPSTNAGSSSTVTTFTFTNSGGLPTSGCAVASLTGANANQFTLSNNTCGTAAIAASGTCSADVAFSPTSIGAKSASLSYVCTSGGTATATLTGTGLEALISSAPASINFGNQQVSVASSAQAGGIQNTGTLAGTSCTLNAITGTNAADFSASLGTCTASLAASGTCAPQITFTPSGTGARSASLTYTCTSGSPTAGNLTATIALSGTGTSAPSIGVSPSSRAYSNTNAGSSSAITTFTFTNSGGTPTSGCTVASLTGTNTNQFTLSNNTCGTGAIAALGTCSADVAFSPTSIGAKSASLSYVCTGGGTATATLTGTGLEALVSSAPASINFGNQQISVASSAQAGGIQNTGTLAGTSCTLNAITGTNAADFSASLGSCTASLAASGTCAPQITFTPSALGARSASLTYTCTTGSPTSANLTATIALSGTGTSAPSIGVSPASRAYSNTNAGSSSTTTTFTFTNSGGSPTSGCTAASLTGTNTNQFTVSNNTCGTTPIAASGTCSADVAFSPTSIGAKSASLSYVCTGGGTATATLSGTGLEALISSSPASINFGNQQISVASSASAGGIQNTGTLAGTSCTLNAITGTNAADFSASLGTCTASIAASGTCAPQITFTPSALGARSASLTYTCTTGSPTAGNLTATIALSGTGTSAPVISVSPTSRPYSNTVIGSSSANFTFTFTNSGGSPTSGCTAASLTGTNAAEFTLSSNICGTGAIAASGTCTANVAFSPTSSGAKSASLEYVCTNGGTATATLTGTGTAPVLAWSPLTAAIGTQVVGIPHNPITFTLQNTGTAAASGCSAPTLSGANPTAFEIIDSCGTLDLPASSQCSVQVRMKQSSFTGIEFEAGSKTATLSRTCSLGGTTLTTANSITLTVKLPIVKQVYGKGDSSFCATLANGRVKCWGLNTNGQLGYGDTVSRGGNSGESMKTLPFVNLGTNFTTENLKVGSTSCASGSDGSVKCWGRNVSGLLGSAGSSPLYGWSNWGYADESDCLINESNDPYCSTILSYSFTDVGGAPGEMGSALASLSFGTSKYAVSLGAHVEASDTVCATFADSTSKCVGNSRLSGYDVGSQQIGDSVSELGDSLLAIDFGTNRSLKKMSGLVGYSSCALLDNNTLWCIGSDASSWQRQSIGSPSDTALHYRSYTVDFGSVNLRAIDFASGHLNYCALLETGVVKCFGNNHHPGGAGATVNGVLGQGDVTQRWVDGVATTVAAAASTSVSTLSKSISLTQWSGFSIRDDGKIYGWGNNNAGTIGQGTTSNTGTPSLVDLGTGYRAKNMATQGNGGCAVLDDGSLKCWGYANDGRLLNGNSSNHLGDAAGEMGDSLPVVDQGSTQASFIDLTAGRGHTCGLLSNGNVKCWGRNTNGQLGYGDTTQRTSPSASTVDLGTGNRAIQIAAGESHTCALLSSGDVKCWGLNSSGQLGDGTTTTRTSPPASVVNLGSGRSYTVAKAKSIHAGRFHTCAVLVNGEVKCWGSNTLNGTGLTAQGQLGTSGTDQVSPYDYSVPWDEWSGERSTTLALGSNNTCTLLSTGDIWCMGRRNEGQTGTGATDCSGSPWGVSCEKVQLGTGKTALKIAYGWDHGCAILNDGTTKCWGNQIGGAGPSTPPGNNPVTVYIPTGENAKDIALGDANTCFLLGNGKVKCIGAGNASLGYENMSQRTVNDATSINLGTNILASKIVAGSQHFCALLGNGAVKCWGLNDFGQLGVGDTTSRGGAASTMGDSLPFVSAY